MHLKLGLEALANMKTALPCALLALFSHFAQAEWIFLPSNVNTNISFRAVHAVSANVVWVGGSGGTVLLTVDGGQTWEKRPVPDAANLDFRGIAAVDAQTAVVMSAGEAEKGQTRIYRTTDGGKQWQLVFQTGEKGVFLDGVAFWDNRNGLVLGDPVDGKWYLLKTSDGGQTWQRLSPDKLPRMLPDEAAFAASNTSLLLQGKSKVWIGSGGAARARVFSSPDRGQTWHVADTPIHSGESSGIFGLRFLDSRHGIAIGGDHKKEREPCRNVIVTADGGRTWQSATSTDPPGLKESVVILPRNNLLAVGPSGTCLSKDFGKSWLKIDLSPFHAASSVAGHCWAVGGKGVIAKWE
jgi:photosystem II stability/assembly factor-like uncharacterized protein